MRKHKFKSEPTKPASSKMSLRYKFNSPKREECAIFYSLRHRKTLAKPYCISNRVASHESSASSTSMIVNHSIECSSLFKSCFLHSSFSFSSRSSILFVAIIVVLLNCRVEVVSSVGSSTNTIKSSSVPERLNHRNSLTTTTTTSPTLTLTTTKSSLSPSNVHQVSPSKHISLSAGNLMPSESATSSVYFESANANYTVRPLAIKSPPPGHSKIPPLPNNDPKTSFSWKSALHLSPPAQALKHLKLKINPLHPSEAKYTNQTTASSQAHSLPPILPAALPFQSGPEFGTYQGLVQPRGPFTNPFFMSSQMVDPLLDQADVHQAGHPVLMDLMHLKGPQGGPTQAAFFSPLGSTDPGQENFAITENEPEMYVKPHHHHHHHHHPHQPHPQYSSSEYVPESKSPVAQNMLFNKDHQSYYTPFKVNTINVYAKYLTHGGGYGAKCSKKGGGKNTVLSIGDIEAATRDAAKTVDWYEATVTDNAVATKRRTPYIPNGVLDSKVFEYASASLKKRKCFNKMDVITILPKIDVSSMVSRYKMPACQQPLKIQCDPKAKYRSIDGSCNNLKMKSWGRSFTCHRRLLPPDYADGVSAPRIAYDGGKLPNARELSVMLLPDIEVQDHKLTSMVMAFGQFVIHDITRTLPTSNDIKCCPSKSAKHPECFAIDIKQYDDELFQKYNQTCMNFVRSIVCNPCSLGPREQQNQATHTFDMSHQYGLRLNDSLALRTMRGGKLRSSATSTYPKEELPPKMQREDPSCNVRPVPPRFKCFESADGIRASQHPALQALHTAFHRRHNMHTDMLAKVNPHWDDEKLYQEARRITTAEQSKMIYGEYLPAIFGKKLMKHFRLGLNYKGYTKYDSKLNPSTIQEFIVAAGRFGHSQINDQFRVLFKDKKMSYSYSLKDNFFETTIVSLGHSGGVLKGMSVDSTEATDPYFVDDIKNNLYHLRKERFGRDLPAFNIQRSRDHGIPGYVFYLDFCFGFKVKGWKDLVTFIPMKQLKKIQAFYKHWKDIDIFIGGISERLIAGAAFGPTFACINGIQFYNFKFGDRFYFEHGYQSGSFSPAQLDTIRKHSSLSSLICKTHPEVSYMPEDAMKKSSSKPCHAFPEINYLLWMDKKYKSPKYKPKSVTGGYHGDSKGGKGGGGGYKGGHGGYGGHGGKGKDHYHYQKHHHGKKNYGHHQEKYHEDPEVDQKYQSEHQYGEGPGDDEDDGSDSAPPSMHRDIVDQYMNTPGLTLPEPHLSHSTGTLKPMPVQSAPELSAGHSSPSTVHSSPPNNEPFVIPPNSTPTTDSKPTIIFH